MYIQYTVRVLNPPAFGHIVLCPEVTEGGFRLLFTWTHADERMLALDLEVFEITHHYQSPDRSC